MIDRLQVCEIGGELKKPAIDRVPTLTRDSELSNEDHIPAQPSHASDLLSHQRQAQHHGQHMGQMGLNEMRQ